MSCPRGTGSPLAPQGPVLPWDPRSMQAPPTSPPPASAPLPCTLAQQPLPLCKPQGFPLPARWDPHAPLGGALPSGGAFWGHPWGRVGPPKAALPLQLAVTPQRWPKDGNDDLQVLHDHGSSERGLGRWALCLSGTWTFLATKRHSIKKAFAPFCTQISTQIISPRHHVDPLRPGILLFSLNAKSTGHGILVNESWFYCVCFQSRALGTSSSYVPDSPGRTPDGAASAPRGRGRTLPRAPAAWSCPVLRSVLHGFSAKGVV